MTTLPVPEPTLDTTTSPDSDDAGESLWRGALKRLVRNPMAIIGAVIIALFILVAIFAPLLAPYEPASTQWTELSTQTFVQGGTSEHLLGIDRFGSDMLTQLIYGARQSLVIGVVSTSIGLLVGVALGVLAGGVGGWVDTVVMRVVDIMLSIPAILLAVLTVAVLGPGFLKLIAVLGFTRWPRYTRVAYAQTLQVANLPYIKAAELGGAGTARILLRHILPNIAGPLLVVATAEFGLMILFEAGLSFLGLGIQPPSPSWGSIMSVGRQYVERAWWLIAFPGAALFLLVFSVNVLGDWLRDQIDPRSRTR